MKEIDAIVRAFHEAGAKGKKTALATVVHVDGSSYRRPGARMLITDDGELTGSISGGCLEGDAFRKAMLAIHSGENMLVTYDTSDEDDAKFGMGLGCNGIIQVLIEPLQGNNGQRLIQLLETASRSRQKSVLVTLFSLQHKKASQTGSCYLLSEDGSVIGNLPAALKPDLLSETRQVMDTERSTFRTLASSEVEQVGFTEIILPPIRLVAIGAGNDVIPLIRMADLLGWQSTVMDGRPAFISKERFPFRSCQTRVTRAAEAVQLIDTDDRTVFVLMSHNYNYDYDVLKTLLSKPVPYIGILGPKTKYQKMLDDLALEGIHPTPMQLQTIFSPIGLDIGAESSEEIALAIVAEIKSVLAGKKPGSLRDKTEPIHDRGELVIEKKTTSHRRLDIGY